MDTASWVIELRREFHRFPELSGEEKRTAARVEEILGSLGIETRRVAKTGVVGLLRGRALGMGPGKETGRGPRKTVALRADMDALQQTERTGLPFASENAGAMHACGHDSHVAMLLGAARTLAEQWDSLSGNVVFLFQPAEELVQGARAMIEDGALEGVDAVFGIHVFDNLATGKVSIEPGPVLAGADIFKVTFRGRGGHGAMPHAGIDTITPACYGLLGLQSMVVKEMDSRHPVVLSVGQIQGGTRFNIIADETWFHGSVRYFQPGTSEVMEEKIRRHVSGVAQAHRNGVEVEYTRGVPPTVNDAALTALARDVAGAELGADCLVKMEPVMGSEDFSFFAQRVPGVFAALGTHNEAKGLVYPNHHPQFTVDEDVLDLGVKLHVGFAKAFLNR